MKAFVALLYMLTVDCCWLFHSSSLQLLLNWDQSQRSSFSNLWIPGKYFSLLIFRFVSIEITSYFLLRHASQNYEFQGSISHSLVSYLLQQYSCDFVQSLQSFETAQWVCFKLQNSTLPSSRGRLLYIHPVVQGQCIIRPSSAYHQRIINASSAHHQRIISASSAHHQSIINASSA